MDHMLCVVCVYVCVCVCVYCVCVCVCVCVLCVCVLCVCVLCVYCVYCVLCIVCVVCVCVCENASLPPLFDEGSCFEAALVAISLAKYVDGTLEKASLYLDASESFWSAAESDRQRGCTDPPELLQLHALDAQAKCVYWFEKAGNKWLHADVLLQGARHLKRLGEHEEAAFYATQSALL